MDGIVHRGVADLRFGEAAGRAFEGALGDFRARRAGDGAQVDQLMGFAEGEGEQLLVFGIEGGGDRLHAGAAQFVRVDVQGQ
ncbi:hypothetical protein D3C84_1050900 [compost metagenome]